MGGGEVHAAGDEFDITAVGGCFIEELQGLAKPFRRIGWQIEGGDGSTANFVMGHHVLLVASHELSLPPDAQLHLHKCATAVHGFSHDAGGVVNDADQCGDAVHAR